MKQTIFKKSRGTRNIYKHVPLGGAGKGFTSVFDRIEGFYYETTIDLDALGYLAAKAATNKSGKARDGALEVKILEREKVNQSNEKRNLK